jgi:hypothetical protein
MKVHCKLVGLTHTGALRFQESMTFLLLFGGMPQLVIFLVFNNMIKKMGPHFLMITLLERLG